MTEKYPLSDKRPTALVTGGAGFIGSHLTEHLLANGWQVRVLDDLSTGRLENLASVFDKIEFIQGSITDRSSVVRAVSGARTVFHLAAKIFVPESFEKPTEYEHVNVHGTAVVLDAAREAGVRRVVMSSTCAVYGDTNELPIKETAPLRPLSPYAANKLAAERLGRRAADAGLPFTALRYFNVYGPRQDPRSPYSGVISRFIHAIRKGDPVTIYGDGSQTRDFVHVNDIAKANLLAALENKLKFSIYNVGTGRETSIRRLYEALSSFSAGHQLKLEPARGGDIMRSVSDPELIKKQLNFVARPIDPSRLADLL